MGEHKHNPTAIAAKNGELPPKLKGMGKRETERYLQALCYEAMTRPIREVLERERKEYEEKCMTIYPAKER